MMHKAEVGLVLLAAGGSRRFGAPKQLLRYQGESLLRRAAKSAQASRCEPVAVVLGAEAERLKEELVGLSVLRVVNPHWHAGIGTSIQAGLKALITAVPDLEGALFTLCDQALIDSPHLNLLVETFIASKAPVIASRYAGTFGVPALFHRALFPDLCVLSGGRGAKEVIARHLPYAHLIDLPEACLDIDTPGEYWRLCNTPPLGDFPVSIEDKGEEEEHEPSRTC